MVPKGIGVPKGHQEVESSLSEEGCNLLVVALFDEAPPCLGARGVPVEHKISICLLLPRGIHSHLGGCGKADDVATVREGECHSNHYRVRRSE